MGILIQTFRWLHTPNLKTEDVDEYGNLYYTQPISDDYRKEGNNLKISCTIVCVNYDLNKNSLLDHKLSHNS